MTLPERFFTDISYGRSASLYGIELNWADMTVLLWKNRRGFRDESFELLELLPGTIVKMTPLQRLQAVLELIDELTSAPAWMGVAGTLRVLRLEDSDGKFVYVKEIFDKRNADIESMHFPYRGSGDRILFDTSASDRTADDVRYIVLALMKAPADQSR